MSVVDKTVLKLRRSSRCCSFIYRAPARCTKVMADDVFISHLYRGLHVVSDWSRKNGPYRNLTLKFNAGKAIVNSCVPWGNILQWCKVAHPRWLKCECFSFFWENFEGCLHLWRLLATFVRCARCHPFSIVLQEIRTDTFTEGLSIIDPNHTTPPYPFEELLTE